MRIFERTRREIAIAPRVTTVDALGAQIEGFSTAHTVARANIFPASGGLERREAGLADGQPLEMTLPAGTQIAPGDGVCIGADAPNWRCVEVQNWSSHCAARLERIAGDSGGSDAESAKPSLFRLTPRKPAWSAAKRSALQNCANRADRRLPPKAARNPRWRVRRTAKRFPPKAAHKSPWQVRQASKQLPRQAAHKPRWRVRRAAKRLPRQVAH